MTISDITLPAVADAVAVIPAPGLLHLIDGFEDGRSGRTLDGAWWPASRELADEVPLLCAAFAERGVRVTRLIYQPSLWLIAPGKVQVDGRKVHLGWFRETDPNQVSVRTSQDQRIELLVVPPEATPDVAAQASEAAAEPGNHVSATEVLRRAALPDPI